MPIARIIMSLLIIIVNYRTPQLTVDCLRSLAGRIGEVPGTRVLVLDNASGDSSVEQIRGAIADPHWETWATLLPLDRNWGFAGGNNRGLETLKDIHRDVKYVLLLNSDTIVRPGALRHCFNVMEAEPSIGVMSCLLLNSDGSMQNVARKFPTPPRMAACSLGLPWLMPRRFGWADLDDPIWDRLTVQRDVEWLGGAFMFIRRELIDRIGGLDEDFFFYGEDIEFCHRVWKAGYRCRYDPGASITHIGGSSSDPTRVPSKQRNVYVWQARYLLQKKCYGRFAAAMLRLIDITGFALRYIKLRIKGKRHKAEYDSFRKMLAMLLRPLPAAVVEKQNSPILIRETNEPRRHKDTKTAAKNSILFFFVFVFVPSCLRG